MAVRMACGGFRLPVLVLLFLTGFRCEKILSQTKRCGDPGCESLMIRAQASRDYRGPDCRYLNFKFGEEILVYYKLSGTRDDLWQGSQGKKSGYFPKDAVNIEEVYISKEVEVPAKETDFVCLDGGEYIFENEDSILHQKDTELDYLNPDTEPYLTVPEGELLKPTRISSDVEKGINPIAEHNEQDITVDRIPSVLVPPKNDEQEPSNKPEIGESTNRDVLPEPVKDSWTVSGFAGWLGMGGKGEEKVLTPMSEPLQENTFHSRKIALSDEIILQKEDKEELETSTSSWFPSGFREFLPFGREETEQVLEEKDKVSVAQTQDNTLVEDSEESTVSIETEALKEDQDENESGDVDSKSKWFNLGLHNMFSFGNIAKGTLNVKEEQTNEDSNQIGVGESKQIMNTLNAGTSGDHESNLKVDGSERQKMLNDRARTDLNEYLDSNQNIAFMETSLSEEYQDTKGQGDISSNSWFNLGLDHILSFRESSKDSSVLKEELIEEAVNMTEMEGETRAVNPRETDSVLDTEETDIMGIRVTEDIGDLETPNNLKEAETTPLTSAWYSNHLENILNLKMHTTTDEPRLAGDEHSKEQVTGLYSTESSVDSILTEPADVEKISKETRSSKEGQVPGVAIQTTTFERNTLLKEESDKKNEQSEQLNKPLSGDGGESIYDPTVLLLANTAAPRQLGEQVKNNNADVENKHIRDLQTETHAISPVHAQEENESTFGIMEHLKSQDILSHVSFIWSTLVAGSDKAVALLPEDLRPGPDLYGFSWEMAICAVLVGVFTVTVFLCQASKAIGSRRYIGRERELASKVAELVENKCKELEKLSIYQKEYEELELSLTDANLLKESSETTCLEATCEKLNQSNSALSEDILTLEKELEEEKSKRSQQDGFIDEIQRRVESLEKEAMSMKSQADEARTTLKVFQINKGRLEMALRDAKEEHVHFQESNEQLLREAEGWGERFNELTEQTKMFESSKQDMEEALNNKECQVKSLTDCLLTMKDWSAELSKENNIHDNNWEAEVTGETENGEHLDDHQKRTVKKLIFAAKLNASLKTLETERNQLYDKLSDEVKAKEELAERIDHLQKEQNSLNSENSQFEFDVQKLQQKLKVMTEMYQENELKLHRKLTVEEKHRLQKEEKLSKVDEKIYHAAEELHNYRTRAKDLEEELEKTIRSYQSQISSHEKKGHDNWLTARAAERQLNDIKKENAHNRQKLTELEFKLEQMEKDPYALDVPRGFGRENSPYGPSPLGRPSPETRAFLSPPTLLEGPLRISPMLPGGERGSRSPGDNADYSNTSERTETGSDRVSDHQGANSDHGSLSPPWERDRRLNVQASGPGQHYPDPSFHPRRQEKYFHNPPISGRFSGPADLLRGYNMHSFEKTDGQLSAENSSLNETNRNGANENHSNEINVADHSLQPENEAVGPCFVPPPQLMRGPLLPMDPRGPFLRRVSPFPPRIMDMYGPRDYFSVPNYSGLPRHPIGMRHPFPSQPFLHFPPLQRPGFLPPPPPPPENRTEQSTGLTYAPKASDAENPNSHQET